MTQEPTDKAPAKPTPEKPGEIDFGQERRQDAQLVMRSVLGRIEKERFSGSRRRADQVAVEFDDATAAGRYYTGELLQYLSDLGADVLPTPERDLVDGGMANHAPWETVLIAGTIPAGVLIGQEKSVGQIMEACAELVRVLLAQACVAAGEDCDEGERIIVRLKAAPEVSGTINLKTGIMAAAARISCIVHTSHEPRVSYLLGTAYGEPKARTLNWQFPLVEQMYGPDRLRWRDLRSPDYEPGADAPPKVLVS